MREIAENGEERPPIVYIVDDDKSVRDSLEDLLASIGIQSASFASTREFLQFERADVPACLVLDVRMPGANGLDFQREMGNVGVDIPIVFITAHGDISMAVQAMKAGAVEFLTKPFREQDLLDAIRQSLASDEARRHNARVETELRRRYERLSDGEREVMDLVVAGLLNKQIAARLALSEVTIKVRRGQVMRKMGAGSLAELVRFAERIHGEPSNLRF